MDIYFPPPQCGAAPRKNIPEGSRSHQAVTSYCRCGPLHSSDCWSLCEPLSLVSKEYQHENTTVEVWNRIHQRFYSVSVTDSE